MTTLNIDMHDREREVRIKVSIDTPDDLDDSQLWLLLAREFVQEADVHGWEKHDLVLSGHEYWLGVLDAFLTSVWSEVAIDEGVQDYARALLDEALVRKNAAGWGEEEA